MTCALDDRGLAEQLDRFTAIGSHALWARRDATEFAVVLDHSLDDALLHQALGIEKDCCPFVALIWDRDTRELTIAAREEHAPVLDRVAEAFAVAV